MKGVQVRRRVLWSCDIQTRKFGVRPRLRRTKNMGDNHHRRMDRNVSSWQDAWRLGRNHPLAAIVALVGRITRHRATALHALLILRRGGETVCELQKQNRYDCQHDKCGSPYHLFRLYCGWTRESTIRMQLFLAVC